MTGANVAEKVQARWYLKPVSLFIAILLVGPLALPLVWWSPALKKRHKALVTIIVLVLTIWLAMASAKIFQSLSGKLQELQAYV